MIKYIIKRSLQSLITVFIAVSIIFVCLRLAAITNRGVEPSVSSLITQLKSFWWKLITTGSFGTTRQYVGSTLNQMLWLKGKYTLALTTGITILSYGLGIPLGIFYAKRRDTWIDFIGQAHYSIVTAIPEFTLYTMIQVMVIRLLGFSPVLKFGYKLGIIDPILAGSLFLTANIAISMRRYVTDQFNTDYVKLAKAKGVSENSLLYKHIFKNILVFLARQLSTTFFVLISAAIYLEWTYMLPGLSQWFFLSFNYFGDTQVVQAIIIIFTIVSVLGMLVSDILVTLVDPRVKIIED